MRNTTHIRISKEAKRKLKVEAEEKDKAIVEIIDEWVEEKLSPTQTKK